MKLPTYYVLTEYEYVQHADVEYLGSAISGIICTKIQ